MQKNVWILQVRPVLKQQTQNLFELLVVLFDGGERHPVYVAWNLKKKWMQKVVEHVVKELTLASFAHSTARTLNVMQTLLANAIGYSLLMAACHVYCTNCA